MEGPNRFGDFQIPIQSLEDYENNRFSEFRFSSGLSSLAVYHISLTPYNESINIIFRSRLNILYRYPLSQPIRTVRMIEAKVIETQSLGKTIKFFKSNVFAVFQKYVDFIIF